MDFERLATIDHLLEVFMRKTQRERTIFAVINYQHCPINDHRDLI